MSTSQTGPVFAGYTEDQLTAPMPCSRPPEKPGVYLRRMNPQVSWVWAEWDGRDWHAGRYALGNAPAAALNLMRSVYGFQGDWRGLNFNPEAAQRPEVQHHPV